MRADAQCRACDAPIRWALTASGRRMPLDAKATQDGNIWVIDTKQGVPIVAIAADPGDIPASVPLRYTNHFDNCPENEKWRP